MRYPPVTTTHRPESAGPLPAGPSLPTVPRAGREPRWSRKAHLLPRARWTAFRHLAEEHSTTPSAALLAVLADVLRTWSTTDRFALGQAICEPARTFADRAQAVRREEVPVASAHETARSVPTVTVTGLPDLPDDREHRDPGAENDTSSASPAGAALQCRFSMAQGGLRMEWTVREDAFPPGVTDAMFDACTRLLTLVATHPGSWAREDFALVPSAQLERRAEINRTADEVPDGLLHEAVARYARSRPDAPAVITSGQRMDYREFSRRVNQIGHRLRRAGVRPGQLVAVVMQKGWEQFVAVHGILAAGGAYLPIDAGVPADRLRALLEYGQVSTVLTQSAMDPQLGWPSSVERLSVDRDFEDEPDSELDPVQQPTDLAYVIFTSGSTGVPKGVMVDHRGALNTIGDINRRFGITSDDRCMALSGLHFDLSVYDAFGITAAGGAIVVPDPSPSPDPAHWSALMESYGVTFWNSVPALLEMLVMYLECTSRRERIEALRLVILAGDWIPLSLPDRLRAQNDRTEVVASGGPAETCVWSVINPLGEIDPAWTSIPYGRPMANQRYHILGPDLRPRPDWVPGEIFIASEVGLAQGYWRDPARTAQQFLRLPGELGRSYASGDMGRYLPDGNIEILGRQDFQVKIQGVRIELGEIEATLTSHPDVRSAVVVAGGKARGLPVLHAYVVPSDARSTADPDELRGFLRTKLPAPMVPPLLTVLDSFPLTPNGKVDRRALSGY